MPRQLAAAQPSEASPGLSVVPPSPPGVLDGTPSEIIRAATRAAHDMLGMDMAYLADTRGGLQAYREVAGDGASFGAAAGDAVDLEGTYCQAMLAGRLGNVVGDALADPVASRLPITQRGRIGAYVGVPVVLSDGTTYGTFCCLSHTAATSLSERDVQFLGVLARLIADQLEREAGESERRRSAVHSGTVRVLVAALEARDGYTEEHSHAVVELALGAADSLGIPERDRADLEHAALLHDIGKIGISDSVLRKEGPLDEHEWAEMRRHPEIGEWIIGSVPELDHLALIIRAEHERWDGTGYPDGLRGEEIPLISRIVLVCDAYHAMTSDRPYRRALTRQDALRELAQHAGTQFCPRSVAAVVQALADGEAASPRPAP